MQLTPVYGPDPILVLEGDAGPVVAATVRQKRRFVEELGRLDAHQWAHPSRCDGWSARDVIVHLESATAFWNFSIGAGLAGKPTRFLADFDPVASPAALVAGAPERTDAEVLEQFATTTRTFCDLVGSLDAEGLATLAEAPPGHLAISALVHHALWDALVHEHDVFDPLGIEVPHHDDEVLAALAYAAGLGAGYDLTRGATRSGTLAIETTRPDARLIVRVTDHVEVSHVDGPLPAADLELRGDAHTLLDALSLRAPLDQPVPADAAWLVDGLATTFDQAR